MKNIAIINIKTENDFIEIMESLCDDIKSNEFMKYVNNMNEIAILSNEYNNKRILHVANIPSHYNIIESCDYLSSNNVPVINYKSNAKGEIGDYLVVLYDKLNKKKQYISDPYFIVNIVNNNYVCRLYDKVNHSFIRTKNIKFFNSEKQAELYIIEYKQTLNDYINDEFTNKVNNLELIDTLKSEIKSLDYDINNKIKKYSIRNLNV